SQLVRLRSRIPGSNRASSWEGAGCAQHPKPGRNMDSEKNVGEKVVAVKRYQENNPDMTFGKKRRVRIRLWMNPGHRCTNWAWDVIAVGTGRTDAHYIPVELLGELRKTLREAERFIKLRQWFWWFFKFID